MECSVQARFDVQTLRKLDKSQQKCRVCTRNRRIKPCFVYKPRKKFRTQEVRFLKIQIREVRFRFLAQDLEQEAAVGAAGQF